MAERRIAWKPILKLLFAACVLTLVGRRLFLDLHQLDFSQQIFRPGWCLLCSLLYLLGLAFSAWYWQRLLTQLGQQPTTSKLIRAYFTAHLGKYVPGKAWAVLIRISLLASPRVRVGVAVQTSFYEVLATMASGGLLAAVLFACCAPTTDLGWSWELLVKLLKLEVPEKSVLDRWLLVSFALLLTLPMLGPMLPAIFNRLSARIAKPFQKEEQQPLPLLGARQLLEGLAFTALGWLALGFSFWAAVQAIVPEPWAFDLALWGRWTAYLAVSYVAGFLLFSPGGLGVREWFLYLFLLPELTVLLGEDDAQVISVRALSVLLLRVIWTVTELVTAGMLALLPTSTPSA